MAEKIAANGATRRKMVRKQVYIHSYQEARLKAIALTSFAAARERSLPGAQRRWTRGDCSDKQR